MFIEVKSSRELGILLVILVVGWIVNHPSRGVQSSRGQVLEDSGLKKNQAMGVEGIPKIMGFSY